MDAPLSSSRLSIISDDLPESLFSDSDSEMGAMVRDSDISERIFVHQLNLTSADVARRQRDKEMVEEEKKKVQDFKEIKRRQKEEEKRRDMEMLMSYNPWGKPGAGARGEDAKRKKYGDEAPRVTIGDEDDELENAEAFMSKFGRPGAGAPNRTPSGRIRTQIAGDPDIRFQDAQLVRLSIENHLRYKNEDKENYRGNLDKLVQQKLHLQEKEKEWERAKFQEMTEMYPFGRSPNNGGSYLSHTEPMFMATRPRRRGYAKEDFDPWGKGFGNPARDDMGNVHRHKFAPSAEEGVPDLSPDPTSQSMSLGLGKVGGGDGAPHMTESGHPKTRLQNTLTNYRSMGPLIQEVSETSYNPWGKPGAGAPFTRADSKLFEEKLGWSMTGHPKKRNREAKNEYRDALQQEIEEKRQRSKEEEIQEKAPIARIRPPQRTNGSAPGAELASIIQKGVGGRPLKDPLTGDLLPNPRRLTDVTQERLDIRRAKSQESLVYHSELSEQAAARQHLRQKQKEMERAQSEKHMTTWDTFWGRPGHGAPRDPENHKKENIENMLSGIDKGGRPYVKHYMTDIVTSKHKNRYDFPSKGAQGFQKDYEFRTPFPAAEG